MPTHQNADIHIPWWVITAFIAVFVVVFFIDLIAQSRDAARGVGGLRGDRIVVILLPQTIAPRQIISLDANGSVAQGGYTTDHDRVSTTAQLPATVFQAADATRAAWCSVPPQFPAPTDDRTVYQIDVSCGLGSEHFQVPVERLPPSFQRMIEFVPPLPHSSH